MKSEGRPRPLRVVFVANDGLSAGHVTRAIAVARGVSAVAATRGLDVAALLITTSEARCIGDDESLAVVRLPPPRGARRGGLSEDERRRLAKASIEAICDSFGPDLLVVDTFPTGPHGELQGLALRGGAKRALVRRRVRDDRADDLRLTRGLERFDVVIVADDPDRESTALPAPVVHVPPITLGEAGNAASREAARARLDLPREGRVVLVTWGGGGDEEALASALRVAKTIAEIEPSTTPVVAIGPLGRSAAVTDSGVRALRVAPISPWFAAFDGVFAAAGYNTAHELAKARVPTALFASARPFDDQAARAQRFASLGIAHALLDLEPSSIRDALAWMTTASPSSIEGGGAIKAAEALLDVACGPPRASTARSAGAR